VAADQDVVENSHRADQLDVLERARDPATRDAVNRRAQQAPPVEAELTRVGLVQARDDVEERRLAGAIRPDQADDLPARRRADVVDPLPPKRRVTLRI
jgi:hypothetical protein